MQSKARHLSMLVPMLCLTGCAHRPPNMTPSQSAEYSVTQSLAVLAQSNKAATSGAIKLQQIGVLSVPTTKAVLAYTKTIAEMDQSGITILKSSATWPDRAGAIYRLIQGLKLPPEVSALLNSPATDQGVRGIISTIQSIQLLLTSVASSTSAASVAGGGK